MAVVDRVNTTMAVWMGTTMACAQCHTHKYDPITQEEYFQFLESKWIQLLLDPDSDIENAVRTISLELSKSIASNNLTDVQHEQLKNFTEMIDDQVYNLE